MKTRPLDTRVRALARALALAAAGVLWTGAAAPAPAPRNTVSVLTWWRTPHEVALLQRLQEQALQQGLQWNSADQHPLASHHYLALVHQALAARTPPDALLVPGSLVPQLAAAGKLAWVDAAAAAGNWQQVLPYSLQRPIRHGLHWAGVPLGVQTFNLLWVHPGLAARLGVVQAPQRWEELVAVLDRAREAGIPGIALSQAPWEYALLFEAIALGLLGYEDFRKGLLQQDGEVLTAERITRILERIDLLLRHAAPRPVRWDAAAAQVAQGQALLQLGGAWGEGEMQRHTPPGAPAMLCWPFPETQGVFSLSGDYLVFPRRPGAPSPAQHQLAQLVMSAAVQQQLAQMGGYIAPRVDVAPRASACRHTLQRSMLQAATRGQQLTPLLTQPSPLRDALIQATAAHTQGRLEIHLAAQRIHAALDHPHAATP